MANNKTLRGYVKNSLGGAISGLSVKAYGRANDGTLTYSGVSTTTDSNGFWQLTVDLDIPESGMYAIEIHNTTTGEKRWIHPDISFMAQEIIGAGGVAPLAAGSVTSTLLASEAATDTVIGSRTVDQNIATSFSNTGNLTTLLSFFAKALKAAVGGTNWYSTPSSGTLNEKVKNAGSTPSIAAGTDASKPSASSAGSGALYLATDTDKLYRSNGTSWVEELVSGSSGSTQNAFANVLVGSTTISADGPSDTLELVAGTNITLTPSATNDRITISSSAGGGITNTSGVVQVTSTSVISTTRVTIATFTNLPAGTYLFVCRLNAASNTPGLYAALNLRVNSTDQTNDVVFGEYGSSEGYFGGTVTGVWLETLTSTSTVYLRARLTATTSGAQMDIQGTNDSQFMYVRLS